MQRVRQQYTTAPDRYNNAIGGNKMHQRVEIWMVSSFELFSFAAFVPSYRRVDPFNHLSLLILRTCGIVKFYM